MTNKIVVRRGASTDKVVPELPFSRDLLPFTKSNGNCPTGIREYRTQAWETFEKLPYPSTADEAWRRTDIKDLFSGSYRLPGFEEYRVLPPVNKTLLQPVENAHYGGQITLLPGGVNLHIESELAALGVIFTDLATAEEQHANLLEYILGRTVSASDGKFAALTTALSSQGILVYIPHGVQIRQPLHSLLWGPGAGLAYFSHILIWMEEGSSLTYLHEAASPSESSTRSFHSGIVEIHVGRSSSLRFIELQSWGEHMWNINHERAQVEQDGNLEWVFVATGSRVTKTFCDLDLVGQGANGRMSGFSFTDGIQHFDYDTQQNHLAPNTTSDLLFKGALKGHSRSVWQGMIYVAPGAQKTDGYQANRNLVLSPNARADSIPGLEILADDVRCTHGATVGKINPEEKFYLSSRGIPSKEAERLLVAGFFEPVIQRIPLEGIRNRLVATIANKMG